MKPIILKVDAEGKILISAEEIQTMVEDAYNAGYADGKGANTLPTVHNNTELLSEFRSNLLKVLA